MKYTIRTDSVANSAGNTDPIIDDRRVVTGCVGVLSKGDGSFGAVSRAEAALLTTAGFGFYSHNGSSFVLVLLNRTLFHLMKIIALDYSHVKQEDGQISQIFLVKSSNSPPVCVETCRCF